MYIDALLLTLLAISVTASQALPASSHDELAKPLLGAQDGMLGASKPEVEPPTDLDHTATSSSLAVRSAAPMVTPHNFLWQDKDLSEVDRAALRLQRLKRLKKMNPKERARARKDPVTARFLQALKQWEEEHGGKNAGVRTSDTMIFQGLPNWLHRRIFQDIKTLQKHLEEGRKAPKRSLDLNLNAHSSRAQRRSVPGYISEQRPWLTKRGKSVVCVHRHH